MKSYNNNLILEPYTGVNKIEATGIKTGFAGIKQKSNLIGLKLLADAQLSFQSPTGSDSGQNSNLLKKGQIVYFQEDQLHVGGWSKKTFTCEGIKGKFILAPSNLMVLVG